MIFLRIRILLKVSYPTGSGSTTLDSWQPFKDPVFGFFCLSAEPDPDLRAPCFTLNDVEDGTDMQTSLSPLQHTGQRLPLKGGVSKDAGIYLQL